MKVVYSHKDLYSRSVIGSGIQSFPPIPNWISTMGLEWLYELLWKSNSLWKEKFAQEK